MRRKLHSEEKSRVKAFSMNNDSSISSLKHSEKQSSELLTFYGKGIPKMPIKHTKGKILM